MFSIKGIYKNKTIHLIEPLHIKKQTNVIITFMDTEEGADDSSYEEDEEFMEDSSTFEDTLTTEEEDEEETSTGDELSEEYYSKIRKHKRYIANGNISLIEDEKETTYPLFDYSAGGLSFISDKIFDIHVSLTASIKDPIEQDTSVLDFEFEVARIEEFEGKYKVGCKFFDEVDEEIWHSLMS